jgi:nicotinic acid mononucleotide adenylyltransferase
MSFKTAKEIADITSKNINAIDQKSIDIISSKIMQAANSGKYDVSIYDHIPDNVKRLLKESGYNVEFINMPDHWRNEDNSYYIISWA